MNWARSHKRFGIAIEQSARCGERLKVSTNIDIQRVLVHRLDDVYAIVRVDRDIVGRDRRVLALRGFVCTGGFAPPPRLGFVTAPDAA